MVVMLELTFEANRARADAETVREVRRFVVGGPTEEVLRQIAPPLNRLLREIIRYPEAAKSLWAEFRTRAEAGTVRDYDEEGRRWEGVFDSWTWVCRTTREMAKDLRQVGVHLEGADRLPDVQHALESLKRRTLDGWPWSTRVMPPVSREMVRQSKEEVARGEGHDLKDFIARLGIRLYPE